MASQPLSSILNLLFDLSLGPHFPITNSLASINNDGAFIDTDSVFNLSSLIDTAVTLTALLLATSMTIEFCACLLVSQNIMVNPFDTHALLTRLI